MNSYRKLFEQISPSESDEQLISKVLARKEEASQKAETMKDTNKKKNIFLKKAVIIPVAAAIALGVTTLSVGAANNWDYTKPLDFSKPLDYIKPFKNIFAQKYEGNVSVSSDVQSTPASDPASQDSTSSVEKVDYAPEIPIGTFDFEKFGKPLNIIMEGDGITTTLTGILAYNDMCLITYTSTATDEVINKTFNKSVPKLYLDFSHRPLKVDGKGPHSWGYNDYLIAEEGNTRTGYLKINFYNSVDILGKKLDITFMLVGNTTVTDKRSILIDFPIAEDVEKKLNVDFKTDSYKGKITNIIISGFTASLDYEGVDEYGQPNVPFVDEINASDALLTLKDGTTVVVKYGGMCIDYDNPSGLSGYIKFEYTYPVDPSDVVSFTFGENTINL